MTCASRYQSACQRYQKAISARTRAATEGPQSATVRTERGFELIEHTAEVGIRAWGGDLREAFAEAARGMFSLMVDLDAVDERESRRVEVTAEDREDLLVRWLNELLFLVDTEGLVFRAFDIERLGERELAATARGERLDPARHLPLTGVKAATYHQLLVEAGPPARVAVILDV